ncbi:MAG: hypothetical protein JEZ09_08990 [Salinivirgaceae bacterium]|nr:hypothetical protein [Salinivirgaceae bacterium]
MKYICLIAVAQFFAITVFSQFNNQFLVSSAGDFYSSSNLSVSYSIGELAIETYEASTAIVTQGFNQTLLNLVGIEESDKSESDLIKIFSNSTYGEFEISINNKKRSSVKTKLLHSF